MNFATMWRTVGQMILQVENSNNIRKYNWSIKYLNRVDSSDSGWIFSCEWKKRIIIWS